MRTQARDWIVHEPPTRGTYCHPHRDVHQTVTGLLFVVRNTEGTPVGYAENVILAGGIRSSLPVHSSDRVVEGWQYLPGKVHLLNGLLISRMSCA